MNHTVPYLKVCGMRQPENVAAVAELARHPQPREEWEKLSLAGRRQVIAALVQPRVSRAETRGQRSPESVLKRVELVWH